VGKGFQILELNVLRGIDRNKASGDDPDGAFLPTEAYNLAPERRGALVPFGRVAELEVDAAPVDLPGTLLGYDERGLASLDAGTGLYRLFNGYRSRVSDGSYGATTVADTPHVHGFGAYRHIAQFFGYDAPGENTEVEPFTSLRPTLTQEGGDEAAQVDYGAGAFIAIAYNPDTPTSWMAIKPDGAAYFTEDLEAGFTAVTSVGITGLRSLACGGDVWVAVGTNGARYSTDDGATWQTPTTGIVASGNLFKVAWSGTLFTVARWESTDNSELLRSGDGNTWVQSSPLETFGSPGVLVEEVIGAFAFSESGLGVAITATNNGASLPHRKVFLSEDGGQTWTWNALAPYSFGFNSGKVRSEPALQLVGGPGNSFWLISDDGRILYLPDMLSSPTVSAAAYTPTSGARWARAVEYDFSRGKWYAIMADGSFWESENGTSIVEVPEMKLDSPPTTTGSDGRALSPDLVRASEDSVVVVGNNAGAGAIRIVEATFGLGAGTYVIYWVSSVSTEGGQLVVDIGSQMVAFESAFGSAVSVALPSISDIIAASMPWVNVADPVELAHAEDLLANRTFVDIYVSYSAVTPGDVTEAEEDSPLTEVVPIFAFSLQPQEVAAPARAIPRDPIGRILGSGDAVMAAAFAGDAEAVVHNGRVWAVLSQEEALYRVADDRGSAEAANLRAGVAIGYSDVGYINLMRQLSYVQLIPAQSDEFVGMVSTPSGLLAFFENETYLIAGDPALGNLQIELYPDIVGADPGTRITKMGGVVFCIWKGDVYALAGGQAQAVSRPAYLFEDQFVDVVAEPCQKCLVAKTATGKTFRYFIEFQQWFENTITAYDYALPSPSDCDANTRYVDSVDRVQSVRRDGTPATPYITYKGIDYGDKNRVDAAYGMLVPVSGDFGFPDGRPELRYKILETDDEVDDALSTSGVLGYREEDTWRFYLPRGLKARLHDFRLILDGMEMGDTLEPQLQLEWVPSHRAFRNASVPSGGEPEDPPDIGIM
jgi:hypothetical protein